MTFRGYLAVMALATIAAWLSWIIVLVAIDPSQAGSLGFAFFYLTLCCALMGTVATAGALVRAWMRREEPHARHASTSLRHGVLVAALALASLILLPRGLLTWWTALLTVAFFSLIEMAVSSARNGRPRP